MNRVVVCKYNFDNECIIDDCDECEEHPMYQQGIADERERIIEELEKLKEDASHYNGDLFIGKESAYNKAIEIVRGGENE